MAFGRLALHTWTLDTTPLDQALAAAREAGFDAVELRRLDFKRCFEAGMETEEVLDLIFAPGFSTADTVTDLSGRGVGMDAARSAIEYAPPWSCGRVFAFVAISRVAA